MPLLLLLLQQHSFIVLLDHRPPLLATNDLPQLMLLLGNLLIKNCCLQIYFNSRGEIFRTYHNLFGHFLFRTRSRFLGFYFKRSLGCLIVVIFFEEIIPLHISIPWFIIIIISVLWNIIFLFFYCRPSTSCTPKSDPLSRLGLGLLLQILFSSIILGSSSIYLQRGRSTLPRSLGGWEPDWWVAHCPS